MKASRTLAVGLTVTALGGIAADAMAGGLAIGTQSGSGTGNAYAGGAAAAEDASTVWYNPAGMVLLSGDTNIAVVGQVIKPSFKFQNNGSTLPAGTGDGGNGGDWTYIPQAYFTTKLNDQWSVGAAFTTPFGLKTEYDAGWRGQPIALNSEVKAFNLNLGVGYKVNDMLAVGGGFNYQKVELKFSSVIAIGFVEPNLSDTGTGYNVGVLFQPTPQTRIGAHYRSAINFQVNGDFTAPAAAGGSGKATAGLTTPDSFSLSMFHALTPKWDIMGDVTWTGWDHLQKLSVVRTTGPLTGTSPVSLTFNWQDTWRTSLGANYKPNDAWKFRFGIAYDQTPTNDADRTARLPDQSRKWLAFGAQWKVTKAGTLDVGYAHEFMNDAIVSNRAPLTGQTLVGQFDSKVDILSLQYSHSF